MRIAKLISIAALCATSFSCKKEEEVDEKEVGSDELFPDMSSINMKLLGSSGTSALEGEDSECDQANLGVFGLPLGAACSTAPLASSLLLGEDFKPGFTCGDYNEEDENAEYGLMIHLMCGSFIQDKTVSMASEESTGSFAISFSKFGIDDAVGHWNKGGVDSYPADIRIWNSDATSLDEAAPFAGIHLESVDKGKAFVTFKDADQTTLGLRIDFENVGDTASCSKSPSSTNCHTQSVQMHANPVQSTDALPAGFNVMVMADSKSAPTFYAVEGKLRYTEDQAGVLFADLGLTTLRTIYFQVIQKSSEVYGKFEFRDADGERLSLAFGDIDLMELLSEGICADITSADSDLQECAKITAADYETLWTGEEAMESITTSPFTIDMETGRPDEAGFVIAD